LLIILSWNATSKDAFDNTTPVNPPIVNKDIKPNVNNKGVLYLKLPPYRVAQGSAFNHFRFSWPII
jgi:hypothetical protein